MTWLRSASRILVDWDGDYPPPYTHQTPYFTEEAIAEMDEKWGYVISFGPENDASRRARKLRVI